MYPVNVNVTHCLYLFISNPLPYLIPFSVFLHNIIQLISEAYLLLPHLLAAETSSPVSVFTSFIIMWSWFFSYPFSQFMLPVTTLSPHSPFSLHSLCAIFSILIILPTFCAFCLLVASFYLFNTLTWLLFIFIIEIHLMK